MTAGKTVEKYVQNWNKCIIILYVTVDMINIIVMEKTDLWLTQTTKIGVHTVNYVLTLIDNVSWFSS